MTSPVSVLVVDDSALMRKMVSTILNEDCDIRVLGQARDGQDAVRLVEELKPDVVTLDVEMPVLDGLGALEQIMQRFPTPVVMVSSMTQAGAEVTLRCLELGAVDFVAKPSGAISLDLEKVAREIVAKVKMAATARTFARSSQRSRLFQTGPTATLPAAESSRAPLSKLKPQLLVIGSSTGGPKALQTLMPALPGNLGLPIVVVQHMPPAFTGPMANRLNTACDYEVREAKDGDKLCSGLALVAPGGKHLIFDSHGVAQLTDEPPVHGVRPSVDVTIASLTQLYGGRIISVLLTGMGKDGARGLKTVRDLGGHTFGEDESTCVIFGMPRAAYEIGGVDRLVPLYAMAGAISKTVLKQAA